MSVEVERIDDEDRERWNDLVARSPQATPFHLDGFVRALSAFSGSTVHRLVGYTGQEPVGVFPVYATSKGPINLAFSPPQNLQAHYHGPLLMNFEKLKQRKAEQRHRWFIDACLDYVDATIDPRFVLVRAGFAYDDPRPFYWRDYDVDLRFTYVVDLTPGEDALLDSFSKDARRNVTKTPDDAYTVYEGEVEEAERIVEHVRARHDEQDEPFGFPDGMIEVLHRELPDGTLRPYTCTIDGDFAGGVLVLDYKDTVYGWMGGAKPNEDVPINDLMDWRIMRDAVDRGRTQYDLVGASPPSICMYKAKFDPDVETYVKLRRVTPMMKMLGTAFERIKQF